jgi:hypothetical protein
MHIPADRRQTLVGLPSMLSLFLLFLCVQASAISYDVALYDVDAYPGKSLSLQVKPLLIPKNGSLPVNADTQEIACSISPEGKVSGEYTFTPSSNDRYQLRFTLRNRSNILDLRCIWVDYAIAQDLQPITFRCAVKSGERGPYSTAGTTIFPRSTGTIVVDLGTDKLGHVFVGAEPLC